MSLIFSLKIRNSIFGHFAWRTRWFENLHCIFAKLWVFISTYHTQTHRGCLFCNFRGSSCSELLSSSSHHASGLSTARRSQNDRKKNVNMQWFWKLDTSWQHRGFQFHYAPIIHQYFIFSCRSKPDNLTLTKMHDSEWNYSPIICFADGYRLMFSAETSSDTWAQIWERARPLNSMNCHRGISMRCLSAHNEGLLGSFEHNRCVIDPSFFTHIIGFSRIDFRHDYTKAKRKSSAIIYFLKIICKLNVNYSISLRRHTSSTLMSQLALIKLQRNLKISCFAPTRFLSPSGSSVISTIAHSHTHAKSTRSLHTIIAPSQYIETAVRPNRSS